MTTGTMTIRDTGSSSASGAGSIAYLTGTPTVGSTVSAAIGGAPSAAVQLSGTWTGSVDFETSMDGGVTWRASQRILVGDVANVVAIAAVTANAAVLMSTVGCTNVRARCTLAMTGTVSVTINPSAGVAPTGVPA